jgi:Pin2-interacting protein X1
VRVLLREGNLGLGAVRGKADGETFGLEVLSGLLGRLNGKSEAQLGKEAAAMRDVKLMRYQNEKYGRMGFVFGGYLIGEEIKKTMDPDESETGSKPRNEKQKKRKRERLESSADADNSKTDSSSPKSLGASQIVETGEPERQAQQSSSEKTKKKEEKKARKEARRLRREQKKLKQSQAKDESETDSRDKDVSENANDRNEESTTTTANQSGASTPMLSGMRGRHVIRQRHIQQKKMACLDEKALNEVSESTTANSMIIDLASDIYDQVKWIDHDFDVFADFIIPIHEIFNSVVAMRYLNVASITMKHLII